MQVVFISNRPRILAETLPYFAAFMPFIDEYLVFCPRGQIAEFRAIASRLSVLDERELLGPQDSAPEPDHQKRNYLLRCGLARHPAVSSAFLMSDDDYRPLVPIAESYYLSGHKHQPYYFHTLAAWEEMLAKIRRRTSYDLGNLNVHRLLRRLNFSTILFSAHMPQVVDKAILEAAVDEFSGYLGEYGSLTEWETYFNFGLDRFPERFHAPCPFNVLGWPDRPHWPWHVRPGSFDFENYSESSYRTGGLFFGLPEKFDPDTHAEATAEKIRRFVRLFDEHETAQAAKRLRKETGIARRLERRVRRAAASLRQVAGAPREARRSTHPAPSAEGDCRFDVAGLFSSGTGLGTAASLLHETLSQVGGGCRTNRIDVTALFAGAPSRSPRRHDLGVPASDTIVACLNPPQGARYFREAARKGLRGRRRIGYWWWEFPTFPERWEPFLADFDEVWVSSKFIHENWRPLLGLPLRWVPIDLRDGPARPPPRPPDAGRPIRLLTAFNLGSTLSRKNPAAAIAVFERVRAAARRDVSLTIKIGKIGAYPGRYVDFLKLDTRQDGIDVVVTDLSEAEFGDLIGAHDMYISMHRAEGLGLPLAQAMWRGKIAVATAWSGNLEFMTPASSILVDCAPTAIADENSNTDAELPCAEPSVDDAASKILEILEDSERMAEMGRLAQGRIAEVSQFAVDYNRRQFCSGGTPDQE